MEFFKPMTNEELAEKFKWFEQNLYPELACHQAQVMMENQRILKERQRKEEPKDA